MAARRMDVLALCFEPPRHRVLREPVDLDVRPQASHLARDRHVALRVAEADRRGDVQRARPAVGAMDGRVSGCTPGEGDVLAEVAYGQVDPDGLAGMRKVPGAPHPLEPPTAQPRERAA